MCLQTSEGNLWFRYSKLWINIYAVHWLNNFTVVEEKSPWTSLLKTTLAVTCCQKRSQMTCAYNLGFLNLSWINILLIRKETPLHLNDVPIEIYGMWEFITNRRNQSRMNPTWPDNSISDYFYCRNLRKLAPFMTARPDHHLAQRAVATCAWRVSLGQHHESPTI